MHCVSTTIRCRSRPNADKPTALRPLRAPSWAHRKEYTDREGEDRAPSRAHDARVHAFSFFAFTASPTLRNALNDTLIRVKTLVFHPSPRSTLENSPFFFENAREIRHRREEKWNNGA